MKTTLPNEDDDDDDYEIGYCKPPKQSRFQKGTSGNRGGRPKKLKPVDELFSIAIAKQVEVNGKKVTKQELFMDALIQYAFKGKIGAMQAVLQLMAGLKSNEPLEFNPLLADQIALNKWFKNQQIQPPKDDVS